MILLFSLLSRKSGFFALYLFILFWGISFPLVAQSSRRGECYLLIGTGIKSGIYRLNNPSGETVPMGFLFDPGEVRDFAVGPERDFHLFFERVDPNYTVYEGNLLRQVFDGTVARANWGFHSVEHFDGRGRFGADETRKPVFRPIGASHSPGPGILASQPLVSPLPPGDVLFPGKNWFAIPNKSWYQTWNPLPASGSHGYSYQIFYDHLELRRREWIEAFWHGNLRGETEEKFLGEIFQERLKRLMLNGCLDACGNGGGSMVFEDADPISSIFWVPPSLDKPARTYCYGAFPGRESYCLHCDGGPTIGTIVAESSAEKARWIGACRKNSQEDWIYILGSDVFEEWIAKLESLPQPLFDIDLVAVSPKDDGTGAVIFAYDRSQGKIFRFNRDETTTSVPFAEPVISFNIQNNLDDMKADREGNLYYACQERIPSYPPSGFTFHQDLVAIFDDGPVQTGFRQGRLIFAQSIYETVYVIKPKSQKAMKLGEILLGKSFYAHAFKIPAEKEGVFAASAADFPQLLEKSGGTYLNWSQQVAEFPETYMPPTCLRLAVLDPYSE